MADIGPPERLEAFSGALMHSAQGRLPVTAGPAPLHGRGGIGFGQAGPLIRDFFIFEEIFLLDWGQSPRLQSIFIDENNTKKNLRKYSNNLKITP